MIFNTSCFLVQNSSRISPDHQSQNRNVTENHERKLKTCCEVLSSLFSDLRLFLSWIKSCICMILKTVICMIVKSCICMIWNHASGKVWILAYFIFHNFCYFSSYNRSKIVTKLKSDLLSIFPKNVTSKKNILIL